MTNAEPTMAAKGIRAQMIQRRAALSDDTRAAAARQLARALARAGALKDRATIAVYAAVRGEISLTPFVQSLPATVTLAWPCSLDDGVLVFHAARLGDLRPGRFGILEPPDGPLLAPEALDAMLIPGSAFSADGGRLGLGGGYYDRYLTRVRTTMPRIGVAYHWQILPTLPLQPHDIPMTHVATDRGVLTCPGAHDGL